MPQHGAWRLSQGVLMHLKSWWLRTGSGGAVCITLAVICCGQGEKKKIKPAELGNVLQ